MVCVCVQMNVVCVDECGVYMAFYLDDTLNFFSLSTRTFRSIIYSRCLVICLVITTVN